MADASFERSVFINCPFDEDYDAILQAMLFCIVYLGFTPRISRERSDAGEARLDKIRGLIESSKFSIHDLSRARATEGGEYFRLNMPFELGLDYACRLYFGKGRDQKRFLILDEQPYRYRISLSDISGFDIEFHQADFQIAVRRVRDWLVNDARIEADAPKRILDRYVDFSGWYFERQLAKGFSEDDIKNYPTNELLSAMLKWLEEGRPVTAA